MKKQKSNRISFFGGVILLIMFFLLSSITPQANALINPSAAYCIALGYNYVVDVNQGGKGFCQLPNSQTVDAWEFLKGKVAQEYSYCTELGYELKTVHDSQKCIVFLTDECSVCVLPDSTEIEVTKFMDLSFSETTCGDGNCGIPENYSSCPQDCPSGSPDGYCDGIPDKKCDPDCLKNQDIDCVRVKVSGGAYNFPQTSAYKATFSLDVTGPKTPTGWLKYYYTKTRMNFVSTTITEFSLSGNTVSISGSGTVNGVSGYTITATVTNGSPDSFGITIKKADGSVYYSAGPGNTSGGDLVISLL
jgi:putative hemolysin